MGIVKTRKKMVFKDGFTTAGSAGFSGPVLVNTTAAFSGPVTLAGSVGLSGHASFTKTVNISGVMTVNTVPAIKAGSGAAAFFGVTTVGCGAATAVFSCAAVQSATQVPYIGLTPYIKGALPSIQASGGILGQMAVISMGTAGYLHIGWTGGLGVTDLVTDVSWIVINRA